MAAKSNETIPGVPQVHIPAKADYQVDEIRRYMRRHGGRAMFYCSTIIFPAEGLTLDDLAGMSRTSIRDYFNGARMRGMNQ